MQDILLPSNKLYLFSDIKTEIPEFIYTTDTDAKRKTWKIINYGPTNTDYKYVSLGPNEALMNNKYLFSSILGTPNKHIKLREICNAVSNDGVFLAIPDYGINAHSDFITEYIPVIYYEGKKIPYKYMEALALFRIGKIIIFFQGALIKKWLNLSTNFLIRENTITKIKVVMVPKVSAYSLSQAKSTTSTSFKKLSSKFIQTDFYSNTANLTGLSLDKENSEAYLIKATTKIDNVDRNVYIYDGLVYHKEIGINPVTNSTSATYKINKRYESDYLSSTSNSYKYLKNNFASVTLK